VAKREKALERARNSPKGWRFEEVRRLLEQWGFEVRPVKGSHFVAHHPETSIRPSLVNHRGDLSPGYVRMAVKAIEEVIAGSGGHR